MSDDQPNVSFSAPHSIEYAYRRSVGPILSRFFTGLRDRHIYGTRTADGRVLVPAAEYDPDTGDAVDEIVEVGPAGVVTSWSWISSPLTEHPLDHPFAFALIRLDGATTSMLHAVDTGDEASMRTGMRVTPRWRAETQGEILDIQCFEPEDDS
jgi:uncharacterized OB-fold protein